MTINQELSQKKSELESYLGQLADLKNGHLDEIVLNKENVKGINLLWECVQDKIDWIDGELRKELEME